MQNQTRSSFQLKQAELAATINALTPQQSRFLKELYRTHGGRQMNLYDIRSAATSLGLADEEIDSLRDQLVVAGLLATSQEGQATIYTFVNEAIAAIDSSEA